MGHATRGGPRAVDSARAAPARKRRVAWLYSARVGIRDSKNQTGPALVFTPSEWDTFTAGVRDGQFTRPA
ncbi:DUF397 domain-containing protein [Nocardia gipuzkoensis]